MFEEETSALPRKRPRLETPPLDAWGVQELQDYILELGAEIARAEAQIARKQSHRSVADSFFKPGAVGDQDE